MTGFHVEPDALTAFAERCEGYGQQMDELSTQLQQARVGRDAFGHIPEVGSRIYTAYDQHVDQCTEAAASAASGIHSIAANVAITATGYEHSDKASNVKGSGG